MRTPSADSLARHSALFLALLVLAGCGEGVATEKDPAAAEKKKLASVDYVPPPAVLPPLLGGAPVALTAVNADAVARDAVEALRHAIALQVWRPNPPLGIKFKQKEVPLGGGTALRSAHYNKKGWGWTETVYNGFVDGARTYAAGRVASHVVFRDKVTGAGIALVAVDGLRIVSADEDVTVWANLVFTIGPMPPAMSGDVALRRDDGYAVQLRGFNLSNEATCVDPADCPAFAGVQVIDGLAGSVNLSTGGSLPLAQTQRLQVVRETQARPARGEIALTGTGNTALRLRFWSTEWLALFLDANGDGAAEALATRSMPDLLADTADAANPVAPDAGAGPARFVVDVGTPYRHSALHSADGNGDFLTARWRVVAATQGAELAFDHDDRPEVTLTALTPGESVVELEVSDGTLHDTTVFVVEARANSVPGATTWLERGPAVATRADSAIAVGSPVVLDYRSSWLESFGPIAPVVTLDPDAETDGLLEDLGDGRIRFTGNRDGVYRVIAQAPLGDGSDLMFTTVAVGDAPWFMPTLSLGASGARSPTFADLDDDGLVDVVAVDSYNTGIDARLVLIRQTAPGRFAAPVRFPSAFLVAIPPAVLDLDGDGALDIAAITPDGVDLFIADGEGGFQDHFVRSDLCFTPGSRALFPSTGAAILDFGGDAAPDLVWNPAGCPPQALRLALGTPGDPASLGAVATAIPYATPGGGTGELVRPLFGDLDGDGRADVVGFENVRPFGGAEQQVLRFYQRQGDGSLSLAGSTTLQPNSNAFPVAVDLDDDGKVELVSRWSTQSGSGVEVSRWTAGAWVTVNYPVPDTLGAPEAADVDGDGTPELVFRDDRALRVMRWSGGGLVLGPREPILGELLALRHLYADVDDDEDIDRLDDSLYLSLARP